MAVAYPQVVLFGDSLFQGAADTVDGFCFQAALQHQVLRRFDVVNRGLSGYNTSNALRVLPQLFAPPTPGGPKIEYFFILLGANDASLPVAVHNQHVPLEKYKEYLRRIINHPNIAAHKPKMFVITPPPLDEIKLARIERAGGRNDPSRQAKISASYSEAARQVAAEHADVTLVDLWKALMDTAIEKTPGFDKSGPYLLGDPKSGTDGYLDRLLSDGLHMTSEAYRIFYSIVRPLVGSEWAGTPEEDRVGYVLPDWRDAPWLEDDADQNGQAS